MKHFADLRHATAYLVKFQNVLGDYPQYFCTSNINPPFVTCPFAHMIILKHPPSLLVQVP